MIRPLRGIQGMQKYVQKFFRKLTGLGARLYQNFERIDDLEAVVSPAKPAKGHDL